MAGVLVVGRLGSVGCSLRLAPEATRNLPGVQPAVVSVGGEFRLRRLHSRQNHWLGFAGQAKGAPDLGSKSVRCASAPVRAHRSGWWVRVWCSEQSRDMFFTVVAPPSRYETR